MYTRILVPLDGSDTAELGLQEALKLACGSQTSLRLLHVVDAYPMIVDLAGVANPQEMIARATKQGQALLDAARSKAAQADVEAAGELVVLSHGRVSDAILEDAASAGCDLVVMGSHGRRGVARMTLGSCAEQVLRASSLPVLLVRAQGVPAIERDF